MKRVGPVRDRAAVHALRSLGVGVWRLGERLGIDVAGATEGPRFAVDDARRRTFDGLIVAARAGDGSVDAASCPFPLHELLTYLVAERVTDIHGNHDLTSSGAHPRTRADIPRLLFRAWDPPPIIADILQHALIGLNDQGAAFFQVPTYGYNYHWSYDRFTYLVAERDLLLHGSNDTALDVLEPRPARDWGTELLAVVACDDGIWPIFYAVVARDRVEAVFTACTHLGRPPRLRRTPPITT